MPTFQRGHTTIAYTDTGAPEGREDAPVILFAHGLLFSGWMFQHQIEHLRGDYRCVTIDFRGQGNSPRALGGYDMDTLTVDVTELLRHLQIPVVNFVGLSMGGFVGIRLAARRPEIVHTLTLMDTAATAEEPANRTKYKMLSKIYRVAGIGPVRSKVAPIMLAPENVDAPWVDEWLAMVDRTDRAGLVKAIESVADRDPCEDEAVRIIAPTLIMVGESDAATPEVKSRRLEELIATTRFHTISGSGHSSTMENPDDVNTILSAFLSEYNA